MSELEYAIKADAGRLRVLGAPYGVDKIGHEFHSGTDFGDLPMVPVISYHGWDELDGKRIGWATKAERDARGQWYDVAFDDPAIGARYVAEATLGKVRASSDAISHLVRPAEALKGFKGKIDRWVIGALSLMGADKFERAINPRAIAMPALKAFYDEMLTALEAGSGESAKAGRVFASRNAARIAQLRKLIDELQAEMPDAFEESASSDADGSDSSTAAATYANPIAHGGDGTGAKATMEETELLKKVEQVIDLKFTAAAKAEEDRKRAEAEAATEAGKREAAVKAQVDAQLEAKLKELDEAAVKAGRPRFFGAGDEPKETDAAKAERNAFEAYYRRGDRAWTEAPAAKAAMNETTASQGGYLVPTLYNNEIVKAIVEGSLLRVAGARQLSIQGTTAFKTPTLTNTNAAVLTAEAAAFDQQEPTLGEVTHAPYKYTRLSKVSDELLADSRVDVFGQVLGPDAANAFVLAENAAFTTGTGSSQPQGIVTGASLGVTAAGASAITADELINLYHSLSYVYRPNAVWMMNDSTLSYIRKLKDTTNQYLIQPGLNGNPVGSLMGRPIVTNNNMAAIATGNRTVLFGDMSYFWIVDFAALEFRRLDELYAANGQVGFRWYKRFDSHVMLSAAIKYLIQA